MSTHLGNRMPARCLSLRCTHRVPTYRPPALFLLFCLPTCHTACMLVAGPCLPISQQHQAIISRAQQSSSSSSSSQPDSVEALVNEARRVESWIDCELSTGCLYHVSAPPVKSLQQIFGEIGNCNVIVCLSQTSVALHLLSRCVPCITHRFLNPPPSCRLPQGDLPAPATTVSTPSKSLAAKPTEWRGRYVSAEEFSIDGRPKPSRLRAKYLITGAIAGVLFGHGIG